jgi:hypothetical protein
VQDNINPPCPGCGQPGNKNGHKQGRQVYMCPNTLCPRRKYIAEPRNVGRPKLPPSHRSGKKPDRHLVSLPDLEYGDLQTKQAAFLHDRLVNTNPKDYITTVMDLQADIQRLSQLQLAQAEMEILANLNLTAELTPVIAAINWNHPEGLTNGEIAALRNYWEIGKRSETTSNTLDRACDRLYNALGLRKVAEYLKTTISANDQASD